MDCPAVSNRLDYPDLLFVSVANLLACSWQVLVLFGRAVNIFPLSYLLNFFRDHKITPKMMFIMWFSGKYLFAYIILYVAAAIHVVLYSFNISKKERSLPRDLYNLNSGSGADGREIYNRWWIYANKCKYIYL